MQPSPYPMDPAGARPQQYPIPDQNTMFDQVLWNYLFFHTYSRLYVIQFQNTMQYNHQQRMMMMQQAQVRARRVQAMTLHQQSTPAFDPIYQGVPMGVNNVPGQSQPLMRYPSGPMQSPNYMVPNAARAQQATGQQIGSPAYPPNNPQMVCELSLKIFELVLLCFLVKCNNNCNNNRLFHILIQMYHRIADSSMYPMLRKQFQPLFPLKSPFMDIQLKSYFKKDQKMATQWPVVKGTVELSVAITINNTSVPIIEVEKSLFVKQYVVPGVNTLEFTVKQCVCPYAFMMQLVMRQPVSKVTQDLFVRTHYNTLEICTQKCVL
uniref:Galectin n=1 Tax=Heterorhabditis bacteriophora TaxID=37862 RepID=A0A1I7W7Q0_HETBA